MQNGEKLVGAAAHDAVVAGNSGAGEQMEVAGRYRVECRAADGTLKWADEFDNLVTTVGKNHLLDNYIAASSFTQTGPYVGLISSVGWSAVAAGDTMASHSGWTEAGNGSNYPVWTTPASNARGTPSWSAASAGSKAFSAAVTFTIGATGGTLKGCFLVLGASAVATNASTAGILFSAGTFTGGDKVVASADTVNVSYTLSV